VTQARFLTSGSIRIHSRCSGDPTGQGQARALADDSRGAGFSSWTTRRNATDTSFPGRRKSNKLVTRSALSTW